MFITTFVAFLFAGSSIPPFFLLPHLVWIFIFVNHISIIILVFLHISSNNNHNHNNNSPPTQSHFVFLRNNCVYLHSELGRPIATLIAHSPNCDCMYVVYSSLPRHTHCLGQDRSESTITLIKSGTSHYENSATTTFGDLPSEYKCERNYTRGECVNFLQWECFCEWEWVC